MAEKLALLLADGFEEMEAIGTVDILRRAELDVSVVSVDNTHTVAGSHGISIGADCGISDLQPEALSLVVMPGGMPGSRNLAESDAVLNLLNSVYQNGGYVAAICAAPLALHKAGLVQGKTITAYPKVSEELTGCKVTDNAVEQDGHVVTGKGPGAVFAFGLRLVSIFCGETEARTLREGMVVVPEAAS